ncbi:hypothetical protein FHX42_005165 [Saccharopolyspora lacisalsi]|uniref:Uncharacterized protein n=1 Tax=Halosaccharopolyspora lacisalsi TaxID=1000566 RepID=A0A839EA89_9PSEU|nr:hypothetical protein [Halosaccharopolyspora lacisalsi]MBA8827758.1 hypothetical protein [Halosaccharopolyspora lacisalsi]
MQIIADAEIDIDTLIRLSIELTNESDGAGLTRDRVWVSPHSMGGRNIERCPGATEDPVLIGAGFRESARTISWW